MGYPYGRAAENCTRYLAVSTARLSSSACRDSPGFFKEPAVDASSRHVKKIWLTGQNPLLALTENSAHHDAEYGLWTPRKRYTSKIE